ncbi:hypothetical protein DFH09DRAFT_1481973 [Mycena vulgaris]|nr:hypothetical protein DFH09DRAFT_1481973 [Mycena vulgaris]
MEALADAAEDELPDDDTIEVDSRMMWEKKIEGLQIKLKAFRVFKTGLKAFRTDTEFTRHMSSEVYGIRGHFPYKKKRYMITARVQTSVVRYSTRVSGEHGGYEGCGNSQGWRKNYFSSVKSRQAGGHQEAPWVLPERRRRVETPQRELVHKLNHGDAGFNTSAASPDNLIRRASLLSPRPISPPQERAQSQVSRYKLLLDVQLSTTTPGEQSHYELKRYILPPNSNDRCEPERVHSLHPN